jgi:putative membrane-bound dehydrogenase-like protein
MPIVFVALAWLVGSDGAFAAEIRLNGHNFTLPDGFEIELVAKSPLVDRPITASYDEQGRLYVSDSAGVNDPVAKQLEDKPHRVVRLEDVDGDGVFDKSIVFADKLMFPEGTLFYDGSLYVATPPSIWKLTDTDGDGVADQREEWFQGKTLTGCANDLHGPYLGPDGFIYWCKGAFAEQNYTIHGKPFKTKASHIFRCRPDGSDLESVMTGGMDNPVDVVILPDGERIFTTTFLVHPGNGLRDGLLHAVYGGVYGKDWNTLDGHPRTGEVMPVLSHMGAAAPCGLECYQSTIFGDEFYGNLFACQFNMHKVSRHVLTPNGATYESQDSDFVVSDNSDFHPTDVLEDADGSLIVVDTGGWYKLCCPTSQLHKPDILGAIYRIKKAGMRKASDPRGLTIDWAKQSATQLLKLAIDPRPAVRQRAAHALQRHADSDELRKLLTRSIQDFDKIDSRDEPLNVPHSAANLMGATSQLWAIDRLGTQEAQTFVRRLLQSDHPQVRQAALHAVSLHRDAKAKPQLLELLETGTPGNRRIAAEALGRIGDTSIIPNLLKAAGGADDRFLEHSITYALIELEDAKAVEEGIQSENARVRKAALIALDQMPGGGLKPNQVIPLLASANEVDLDTANWLLKRHPEWGNDVAGWFSEQLAKLPHEAAKISDAQLARLESQLATFTGTETIRRLLAATAGDEKKPLTARKLALRVMAKAKVSELPPLWAETLTGLLVCHCPVVVDAVAVARSLPGTKEPHPGMIAALRELASRPEQEIATRLDALAAIPTGLMDVGDDEFALIVDGLKSDNTVSMRSASADILSKATLTEKQLLQLCDVVKTVSPLELDRVLGAFAQSTSEAAGLKLLGTLKDAASLTSLRVDSLRQKLAKYSPQVVQGIDKLESLVNVDAATQRARIEELLTHVKSGDVRRGQAIFNSSKAACLACHKFGYVGGLTGPDLTRIGGIRQERDLLESILYPSLSFVRSYEPVVISTVDGKVVNGLIRNETADEIILATGPNKEERVRKADVDEIKPSTVSIMPAGLDKQLSEQDLLDLVAFLKNAK